MIELLPELQKGLRAAGRDVTDFEATVYGFILPEPELLARLSVAGVQRAVLGVPPLPEDQALAFIGRLTKLGEGVLSPA